MHVQLVIQPSFSHYQLLSGGHHLLLILLLLVARHNQIFQFLLVMWSSFSVLAFKI
jgi:hypothetical protein